MGKYYFVHYKIILRTNISEIVDEGNLLHLADSPPEALNIAFDDIRGSMRLNPNINLETHKIIIVSFNSVEE